MIPIYRVPVSKDKLLALAPEERVLFFLLGYAANQITLFQKLLILSTNNNPENSEEQVLAAAQSQMLARLAIGILNEAYEVIHKRFLGRLIGKEYVDRLDAGGRAALERLKERFGKSNLLTKLRTNFAFHHPSDGDVEAGFQATLKVDDLNAYWNWYMANSPINFFYLASDLVILGGMMKTAKQDTLIAAQEVIMAEVRGANDDLLEFISAFVVALWRKHFGQEFESAICADITTAPNLMTTVIPFFLRTNAVSIS
ncbi:MAG TPA: hypothetical protein VGF97_15145 [Rhizomicrobium sp.]